MSDSAGEQVLAGSGASGMVAQSLFSADVDACRNSQGEPYPREFVTLGLVAFCLSFWAIVIFSVAHTG